MLTHAHRFHGHGSLRYLFSKGKSVRSRHFMVRYVPNKNRLHSRFAVVVSKKVCKHAADRNRIRRRVFEVIRQEFTQTKDVYDVSITVFSAEVLALPYEEMKSELVALLGQPGVFEKE